MGERCVTLRVTFLDGVEVEYPVHGDGCWRWRHDPPGDVPMLIVRPHRTGSRHEVPVTNIRSVMVVIPPPPAPQEPSPEQGT